LWHPWFSSIPGGYKRFDRANGRDKGSNGIHPRSSGNHREEDGMENGANAPLTVDLTDPVQLADALAVLTRLDRVEVLAPQGNAHRMIGRSSIRYGKAIGDYVRIVSDEGRFLIRGRISQMEKRWERFGFVRTHRAYVVNGGRVQELRRNGNGTASVVLAGGETIPVSRRRLAQVRAELLA
jgi:DNA-binding LytR/AlgR family response regulator